MAAFAANPSCTKLPSISEIRALAQELGIEEHAYNSRSRVLAYVSNYAPAAGGGLRLLTAAAEEEERVRGGDIVRVKIEVYYTTGKVKTSLHHPTQGKTQLFRGGEAFEVTLPQLRAILLNPRVHTESGWKTKAQREAKERAALRDGFSRLELGDGEGLTEEALAKHDAAHLVIERRQFHCPEHGTWWKKVKGKPVARCPRCPVGSDSLGQGRKKFVAVPREEERGYGKFRCEVCNVEWSSVKACRSLSQPCSGCNEYKAPYFVGAKPHWKREKDQRRRQMPIVREKAPSDFSAAEYDGPAGGGGSGARGGYGGGGGVGGGYPSGGGNGGGYSGGSSESGSDAGGYRRPGGGGDGQGHWCSGCATGACQRPPPHSLVHHSTGSTASTCSAATWTTMGSTSSRLSGRSRGSRRSGRRHEGAAQ